MQSIQSGGDGSAASLLSAIQRAESSSSSSKNNKRKRSPSPAAPPPPTVIEGKGDFKRSLACVSPGTSAGAAASGAASGAAASPLPPSTPGMEPVKSPPLLSSGGSSGSIYRQSLLLQRPQVAVYAAPRPVRSSDWKLGGVVKTVCKAIDRPATNFWVTERTQLYLRREPKNVADPDAIRVMARQSSIEPYLKSDVSPVQRMASAGSGAGAGSGSGVSSSSHASASAGGAQLESKTMATAASAGPSSWSTPEASVPLGYLPAQLAKHVAPIMDHRRFGAEMAIDCYIVGRPSGGLSDRHNLRAETWVDVELELFMKLGAAGPMDAGPSADDELMDLIYGLVERTQLSEQVCI